MAFEVHNKTADGFEMIILADTAAGTEVGILPAVGASLHAFTIRHGRTGLNLVDSYKDPADLEANLSISYKNARLSPFACRIKDATYTFRGKQYTFTSRFNDGNAIHGLLYNRPFSVKSKAAGEERATVTLACQYQHENPGYPFDYECEVTYTLEKENSLTVHTQVTNLSEEVIPLMDGWHPYFTTGSKVDELYLQFFAKEIVEFDARLIPTGRLLPYHEFNQEKMLGPAELDNSFVLDFGHDQPLCLLRDEQKKITIAFYPDRSYPILQIYTPPHRQSIAIENISGAPDAFNNGILLKELKPGESADFKTVYKVSAY